MSWAQEEWKSGLPSNALIKISELEDNVEKLVKDKKCIQFQADSLQVALDKSKVSEENIKKEKLDAEKNTGDLVADLEERDGQLEKAKTAAKEKDIAILNLVNEVSNAKKERDFEKEGRVKVERECEEMQEELFDTNCRLDVLNQQFKENKEATPMIIEQHELTKKDLEACRLENCRLNEEILKVKEERDLEQKEREALQKKIEEIEKDEPRKMVEELEGKLKEKDGKIEELEKYIEDLKCFSDEDRHNHTFSIQRLTTQEDNSKHNLEGRDVDLSERMLELEEENTALFAVIEEEKKKFSSLEEAYELDAMSLREELDEIAKALAVAEKERDDFSEQLQDEREMFMDAEEKMRKEMEAAVKEKDKIRLQGQEEREMAIKTERMLDKEIRELQNEMEKYKRGENRKEKVEEEYQKQGTTETVDNLRKKNSKLEIKNSCLLEEISKGQEHCSDIEETMKSDIESIRSCLQSEIDHLEKTNRELYSKVKEEKDARKNLQKHLEELSNELDEINDVLCKEREKMKNLVEEIDEMRRQEEYQKKFEGLENKDSHYEEKGALSKLVKKRSDRWNVEVYELKKRIEELEKMNRELTNNLDKKTSSVGSLKKDFESRFKEGSATRDNVKSATATPEFARTKQYDTPVKKFSARRLNISHDMNTPEHQQSVLEEKERKIQALKKELGVVKEAKSKDAKKYEMQVNVLENEVGLMRQQIMEKDDMMKNMAIKISKLSDDGSSRGIRVLNGALIKDSGVEIQNKSSCGMKMKMKSVDDLKELVTEFEKESSELQEIIDESKEAIFELTKALQGSEEVFLVDSKNNPEIIGNSVRFNRVENEDFGNDCNNKELQKVEIPSEKQSYILSRLSLTDIDVTAVLSKLRIAVSQLESRLDICQSEKKMMEAKIKIKDKEQKAGVARKDIDQDLLPETKSSRSAVIDIARKRDATIIDGTIDDLAHDENKKERDEKVFKHGNRCKLLWQQLCDARASLSGYEREVNRQKSIHQRHLAECQESVKKTSEVQKSIAEVGKLAQEQHYKQEYVIADLEEKLLQEKKSSELLQQRIESSLSQMEEEQRKSAMFGGQLEESRSLLYKHHKSNESKMDAIMSFMKNDLIAQFKQLKVADARRMSPVNSGGRATATHSRSNSRNTSFHSPEGNIEAELAAKKSRGHRTRGIEDQAYRTAAHGYKTIDELEMMKAKMNGVQDHVKTLIGSIDQLQREKCKLQDERTRLIDRIYMKEEEVRKAESRVEAEKRKGKDADIEYRAEFDALKVEEQKMFHEFRENCNLIKRRDIELLNKTKQIKLLTAEWKEAEQKLNNQLESLRNENKTLWSENSELRVELEKSKSQIEDFVRKMSNAEDQLSELYQKLSNLDNMFYECKQKALYQ